MCTRAACGEHKSRIITAYVPAPGQGQAVAYFSPVPKMHTVGGTILMKVYPAVASGAVGEGLISSRALLWDALAVEPPAQRGREGHKMRCGALNITSLQDKTVLS